MALYPRHAQVSIARILRARYLTMFRSGTGWGIEPFADPPIAVVMGGIVCA